MIAITLQKFCDNAAASSYPKLDHDQAKKGLHRIRAYIHPLGSFFGCKPYSNTAQGFLLAGGQAELGAERAYGFVARPVPFQVECQERLRCQVVLQLDAEYPAFIVTRPDPEAQADNGKLGNVHIANGLLHVAQYAGCEYGPESPGVQPAQNRRGAAIESYRV
jgi:hypothetical protein